MSHPPANTIGPWPTAPNLILEHLRAIRTENAALADQLREMIIRLQSVESTCASIKQDIANHYAEIALINLRFDNLSSHVNRAERRLDLGPA